MVAHVNMETEIQSQTELNTALVQKNAELQEAYDDKDRQLIETQAKLDELKEKSERKGKGREVRARLSDVTRITEAPPPSAPAWKPLT